jgi:hypothetical protein
MSLEQTPILVREFLAHGCDRREFRFYLLGELGPR